MGQRRAEEGHDAVAQHLVHRALEAVYGVHHGVQGRVEELLGGFRVEIPDQLGRVFDVGEQHRDLLAFACQGATGGEDLLCEMGRGIGEGRAFLGGGRWSGSREPRRWCAVSTAPPD